MPRTNDGNEVIKELSALQIFRLVTSSPFAQAITAPLARGASTATVAATTNATAADPVMIIGDGGTELNALGTPATTMPLKYKAEFAQSTGAMIREAVAAALGHISPDGITFTGTRDLVPIVSALARTPIKYVQAGVADLKLNFELILWNNPNLAFLFGQDESLELGTGVLASDPYQIGVGLASIGNYSSPQCIRSTATFVDGRTIMNDFCDAVMRVNGRVQIGARPDQFRVPVELGFTNLIQRIGT